LTWIRNLEACILLVLVSPGALNGGAKVKDAVVSILGKEWPLSLKEIYFAVVREYSLEVSHQAVHKALKQLAANGVLVKSERKYCLDIEWIRNVKRFGASMEKAYQEQEIPDSTGWLKESQPRVFK